MLKVIVLLCFAFAVSVFAVPLQSEPKKTFSVPELVNIALERSELLTAQEKTIEASRHSKNQAGAWQNPSLSFNAGNKSAQGKNGLAFDAGISQTFPFPGKLKTAADVAQVQEKIAGLNLAEARLLVRYSVIRLSYQYALAEELSRHLEERVSRFKAIKKYLSSRPFPSPKKNIEKHIIEMKLVLLSKNLDNLRMSRDITWARLNLYLGLRKQVLIRAPWYEKGDPLDFNVLAARMETGNIDLKKQALVLERTRAETRLARSLASPDFSLSVLYREERAPEVERFFGAGITFNFPLWNRNRSAVKSLEATVEAENARLAYSRREAEQTLAVSCLEYDLARKNLERFPLSILESVHSRMNQADDAFYKGFIDAVTYGEMESQAFEMHLAVLGAQYEYVDKYAALQVLQGSEEFRFPPTASKSR